MPDFDTAAQVMAALTERPVRHLVNGSLLDAGTRLDVIDPATGAPCATAPGATRAVLDQAVAAARAAQPGWAATPVEERRRRLLLMAETLRDHAAELGAIITLEQGKILPRAVDEVMRAAQMLSEIVAIGIGTEVLREDSRGRVEMHYRPLGVVGAIAPWNQPVGLAVPMITHAMYTGNTVVLKPSPYTPLGTLRMGELVRDLLPPGVLNVVGGGDEIGRAISEHPGIDKISFTGSVATGRKVMASAAGTLKRLTLELGGNDAAIVLPDADLDQAVPKLFGAAFINSGQVCMAIKRLYVHNSIYDEVCARLARLAREARLGSGFDRDSTMGPVQNAAQFAFVNGILADTEAAGGTMLAGGSARQGPGYFIEPTVVSGIADGTRLVDEEPFGPVLPVLRYADLDDAVARANEGPFGLAGSVWSRDVAKAAAVAARLETGTVWINHHVGADTGVPFGGERQSGIGRQYGIAGLRSYMMSTAIFIPPG